MVWRGVQGGMTDFSLGRDFMMVSTALAARSLPTLGSAGRAVVSVLLLPPVAIGVGGG